MDELVKALQTVIQNLQLQSHAQVHSSSPLSQSLRLEPYDEMQESFTTYIQRLENFLNIKQLTGVDDDTDTRKEYGGGLMACVSDESDIKSSKNKSDDKCADFTESAMSSLDHNKQDQCNVSVICANPEDKKSNLETSKSYDSVSTKDNEKREDDDNEYSDSDEDEIDDNDDDNDGIDDDFDDNEDEDGADNDMNISDIDEMLNENLPERYRSDLESVQEKLKEKRGHSEPDFLELEKTVMDDLGFGNFDILPEGWITVIHRIGVPVYLNKATRVVTLARPYVLGNADVEDHGIPVSAIPCLQHRKSATHYTTDGEIPMRTIKNMKVPVCKVESIEENQMSQLLRPEELETYCKNKLKYKTVTMKCKAIEKSTQNVTNNYGDVCPTLPPGTVLISIPIFTKDEKGNVIRRKEWVMNPCGKSYVAVLHEFTQHILKVHPNYEFTNLGNCKDECYQASVMLNGEKFGTGEGTSKREAKSKAAKATIEILIPELKNKLDDTFNIKKRSTGKQSDERNVFDEMKITDPRVVELVGKTTEPTPYSMLLNCLRRNYGASEVNVQYKVSTNPHKYNLYTMIVGKHVITAKCRNKREGKQKAAQGVLQALHPQLETWGSIVRLYGNRSIKRPREKKAEEQEITHLQSQASDDSPNFAILNNLTEKLREIKKRRDETKTLGVLIQKDVPNMSGVHLSSLNYK